MRKILILALAMPAVLGARAAAALSFTFQEVQVPGAVYTEVYDINNAGTMVGSYYDGQSVIHCFLRKGGNFTTLDDPKGNSPSCNAINSHDTVVGYYVKSDFSTQAFVYKAGKFKDLTPTGATSSMANGINDAGVIVGSYTDSSHLEHGFVWDGKQFTQLDAPDSTFTQAVGINRNVLITVQGGKNGATNSYLYSAGNYTEIDVPDAIDSYVGGINSAGDMVYTWWDSGGVPHGALRTANGKYHTFDYPGASETNGSGINDRRLLVGTFSTTLGATDGLEAKY